MVLKAYTAFSDNALIAQIPKVDGINFIEHVSFSAFHEGIRIPQCIAGQQALFRKRVTHLAADRIYATNYNRIYCFAHHITTSFIRKGRAGKDEAQAVIMRKLLRDIQEILTHIIINKLYTNYSTKLPQF
jgi:hypothetical protein